MTANELQQWVDKVQLTTEEKVRELRAMQLLGCDEAGNMADLLESAKDLNLCLSETLTSDEMRKIIEAYDNIMTDPELSADEFVSDFPIDCWYGHADMDVHFNRDGMSFDRALVHVYPVKDGAGDYCAGRTFLWSALVLRAHREKLL